jgi:lysozyme family protein
MSVSFDQAFGFVIGVEGGFTDNRQDPGNWTGGVAGKGELRGTKYGVSAAAYPDLDIQNLSLEGAKAIYQRDYWAPVQGDALSPPLALLVFDAAVNNGVSRAAQWLQQAVGAAADGVIGPKTLAAVTAACTAHGGAAVCAEFMAQRTFFMAGLGTWQTFGLGWARRLCALPYQSVQMGSA